MNWRGTFQKLSVARSPVLCPLYSSLLDTKNLRVNSERAFFNIVCFCLLIITRTKGMVDFRALNDCAR